VVAAEKLKKAMTTGGVDKWGVEGVFGGWTHGPVFWEAWRARWWVLCAN